MITSLINTNRNFNVTSPAYVERSPRIFSAFISLIFKSIMETEYYVMGDRLEKEALAIFLFYPLSLSSKNRL